MKKILKIIGLLLLLAIAFVLIAGLFVKKEYHMEREVSINAPKEKVWANIESMQAFSKWNPFLDKDPNVKTGFAGTPGAVGSTYSWDGNKDVGKGTQTITGINKPDSINTHLHFIEPFSGEAEAFVKLNVEGATTKATWGFDTKYEYPLNVMLLFVNMDKMMGAEFEKGLKRLKKISETN